MNGNVFLSGQCDLHTHSVASDGTDTPTQLVCKANECGLRAIALCDHNTLAGIPELLVAAKKYGTDAVPGIEISSEYEGCEVHIIGLFIPDEAFAPLDDFLEQVRLAKLSAYQELYEALVGAGYKLSYDAIFTRNGESINRVHFARELMKRGYVATISEAFSELLREGGKFYHPTKRPDALKVIALLSSLSCVSVLAHPFLSLDEPSLLRLLPQAKRCGLVAIEAIYSTFDPEQRERLAELASEHGLLVSGGSDYHGDNKPNIRLGIGTGDLNVPSSIYETLAKLSAR